MGIHEIYGVGEPAAIDLDDEAPPLADDETAAPGDETAAPAGDESAEHHAPQTATPPVVATPTRDAVSEIERILAQGDHAVGPAAPFLTGASHLVDDTPPGKQTKSRIRALWHSLVGDDHASQAADDPDPGADEDSGSGDTSHEPAGADKKPGANSMLRTRHLAVAAAFVVVALLAAIIVGKGATARNETSSDTAPRPSAQAASARDVPIDPLDVKAETCNGGSSDPKAAFDKDKKNAWKCLAPYHGVGTILWITLPDQYVITEVRVLPGFKAAALDGSDQWIKHRVVSSVNWRFDDKFPQRQDFNGSQKIQPLTVPKRVAAIVSMTITKTDAPQQTPPPTKSVGVPPPQPNSRGNWLDDIINSHAKPDKSSPISDPNATEPDAFAISSIEIIGHPVP
jgi:hypothetical protein